MLLLAAGVSHGFSPAAARAQVADPSDDPRSDDLTTDLAPTSAESTVVVPAPAEPSLEEQQILLEGRKTEAKLTRLTETVGHLLSEARRASDIVQQMCLDDKLSQAGVAAESAFETLESLRSAAASGDRAELQRAQAVLQSLEETASLLAAEANDCIGEQRKFERGPERNLTEDPDIPVVDTTSPEPSGAAPMNSTTENGIPNTVELQDPPIQVSPVL